MLQEILLKTDKIDNLYMTKFTSCVLEDKMQEILQKTDNMDKPYNRGKMQEILQKTDKMDKMYTSKGAWQSQRPLCQELGLKLSITYKQHLTLVLSFFYEWGPSCRPRGLWLRQAPL